MEDLINCYKGWSASLDDRGENFTTYAVHLSTMTIAKHFMEGSACEDNGCSAAFGGAGTCVKLGSLSLDQLAQKFVTFSEC